MKQQVIPAFKKTLSMSIYPFEEVSVKKILKFIKNSDEALEYIKELKSGFVYDSLKITGSYLFGKILATKSKELTIIEDEEIKDKVLNIIEEGFVIIGGGYICVKGAKLVKDTLVQCLKPKYYFEPKSNIKFPPQRLKVLASECTMGKKIIFTDVVDEEMDEIAYKGELASDFIELEDGSIKNFSAEFILDGLRTVSFNKTGTVSIAANKKQDYTPKFFDDLFQLLDGVCE